VENGSSRQIREKARGDVLTRFENDTTVQDVFFEDCVNGMKKHVADGSIDLVVTSAPYWNIVDYGDEHQIGYTQSLENYIISMTHVFEQCLRVLRDSRRMVLNISDVLVHEKKSFRVVPIHAYLLLAALSIGFMHNATIYWYKFTNCSGREGSRRMSILGSYPYPPNAHVMSKVEHIIVLRKPGDYKQTIKDTMAKQRSRLTLDEWLLYTEQIWKFNGEKDEHPAAYPIELPSRCIKLWSLVGETVLDPFLGSGTTLVACQRLGRNGIGFEISKKYIDLIFSKLSRLSRKKMY